MILNLELLGVEISYVSLMGGRFVKILYFNLYVLFLLIMMMLLFIIGFFGLVVIKKNYLVKVLIIYVFIFLNIKFYSFGYIIFVIFNFGCLILLRIM